MYALDTFHYPVKKENTLKGKHAMRTAEKTVKLVYFCTKKKKEKTAQLSLTALLVAFFGNMFRFKKSTLETTVNLMHPLRQRRSLLPVATRQTFKFEYGCIFQPYKIYLSYTYGDLPTKKARNKFSFKSWSK